MIDPTFEPGSGWYRRGPSAPGSPADRGARISAARPAWVYRMRSLGQRVRAELVPAPTYGLLLATKPGPDEVWHLHLLQDDAWTEIAALAFCHLLREGADGTRLYRGMEEDPEDGRRWHQTWLCTPTVDAGTEILERMAEQQW